MDIAYVTRSAFLAACEAAIRNSRERLDAGDSVEVVFEDGGYSGRIPVEICDDNSTFGADWESTDVTRFPARIRAAATALHNCGLRGRYVIEHQGGRLTIRPA